MQEGFTISFWVKFSVLEKSKEQSVLALQKNVSFSSLRLGLKNSKFFLTIKYYFYCFINLHRNTNNVEETYYSEKELKAKKWYHIAIRVK